MLKSSLLVLRSISEKDTFLETKRLFLSILALCFRSFYPQTRCNDERDYGPPPFTEASSVPAVDVAPSEDVASPALAAGLVAEDALGADLAKALNCIIACIKTAAFLSEVLATAGNFNNIISDGLFAKSIL